MAYKHHRKSDQVTALPATARAQGGQAVTLYPKRTFEYWDEGLSFVEIGKRLTDEFGEKKVPAKYAETRARASFGIACEVLHTQTRKH